MIKTDDKIKYVPVDMLFDHPKQLEIYGELKADPELVASIVDRGVLQPLLIADKGWFVKEDGGLEHVGGMTPDMYKEMKHLIVAGHRRLRAAVEAGLTEVPCIESIYFNEESIMIDFLHSNRQRVKTKAEIKNEFFEYKQILRQLEQVKKNTKGYADKKTLSDSFSRFLKKLNIDIEKPIDGVEIIEKATGVSENQNKLWTRIFDDDLHTKKFDKWESLGLTGANYATVFDKWNEIRDSVEAEQMSEQQGYDMLGEMFKEVERQLKGEPKKAKKKAGANGRSPQQSSARLSQQSPDNSELILEILTDTDFKEKYEIENAFQGEEFKLAKDIEEGFVYPCVIQTDDDKTIYHIISWEGLRDVI